jgi:hypothetical protein
MNEPSSSASSIIQPSGVIDWQDPAMWGARGAAWRWWAECPRSGCRAADGAPCTEAKHGAIGIVPPHPERERLPQIGRPPVAGRGYSASQVRAVMNRPDGPI